jgi:heme exporter protein C
MELLKHKSTWRTLNLVLAAVLVTYALVQGMLQQLPYQGPNLGQTSRNVFYHVPMWFAMMVLAYTSVVYSVIYLRTGNLKMDLRAREAARLTVLFGVLGLLTGIVWSRVTWGEAMPDSDPAAWWPWDPKQTSALIVVLIYLGLFLLRMSFEEPVQRAKVASVFNIFAAASIYPLFYIVPKSLESLHPNTGGKQSALGSMSVEFYGVFWPAVIGFICLGIALFDLRARAAVASLKIQEMYDE